MVEGFTQLEAKLTALEEKYGEPISVIVGYTQYYAVYVHENLDAHHDNGQAKFLEEPARRHKREIARLITDALKQGKNIEQALLLGGYRLLRESQVLVPVATGALKASGFVDVE